MRFLAARRYWNIEPRTDFGETVAGQSEVSRQAAHRCLPDEGIEFFARNLAALQNGLMIHDGSDPAGSLQRGQHSKRNGQRYN